MMMVYYQPMYTCTTSNYTHSLSLSLSLSLSHTHTHTHTFLYTLIHVHYIGTFHLYIPVLLSTVCVLHVYTHTHTVLEDPIGHSRGNSRLHLSRGTQVTRWRWLLRPRVRLVVSGCGLVRDVGGRYSVLCRVGGWHLQQDHGSQELTWVPHGHPHCSSR